MVLAIFIVSPVDAITERQSRIQSAKTASSTGAVEKNNFCINLDATSLTIGQRLDQREEWLEEKRADRLNNLAKRRLNRDERLSQFRDNWEDARTKLFERLEAQATTTEQKQAVAVFISAINEADAAKKAAINEAIKAYRENLDALVNERKEAVDKAKANHRAATEAVFQKAETDCASGIDALTVRTEAREALAVERDAYRAKVVAIEKLADKAKDLATTRQEAIKEAVDDFKQALSTARVPLKAAFSEE